MRATVVILTSLILVLGSAVAAADAGKNQAQKGRSQDQELVKGQQAKAGKHYEETDQQARNRSEEMERAEKKNYEEMGQDQGQRNEKMNRAGPKREDKGRN